MIFNRNIPVYGKSIEQPPNDLVKNTLSLWNASVEDAIKYGGDLTREALSVIPIYNNRKYVVVDTKIHMLMPGMCPAIPGWHTDGVPRSPNGSPVGDNKPDLELQQKLSDEGRTTYYHLLVTGEGCLTEFLNNKNDRSISIGIPNNVGYNLYRHISQEINHRINTGEIIPYAIKSCTSLTWDWWELHSGVIATKKEWRFLIRVTETDFLQPCKDVRSMIRTQNQVYVPMEFGW